MRKFKTCSRRGLPFRLLVILAGALLLLAVFAPQANADLLRFYDMEGTDTPPYPVNLDSHTPALETGDQTLFLDNGTAGTPFPSIRTSQQVGIPMNLPVGAGPNNTSIGFTRSMQSDLGVEIPMTSSQGIYDVTSVSFAYASNGNGWDSVRLQMSTDHGATFTTNLSGVIALPPTGSSGATINILVTAGTTPGINNLVLRLLFTGGGPGADLQFALDNIQIGGTAVPEPATVAGGLLGVLGLCWFQRRRLICWVRLRRT
jgi:hypothetical protein